MRFVIINFEDFIKLFNTKTNVVNINFYTNVKTIINNEIIIYEDEKTYVKLLIMINNYFNI